MPTRPHYFLFAFLLLCFCSPLVVAYPNGFTLQNRDDTSVSLTSETTTPTSVSNSQSSPIPSSLGTSTFSDTNSLKSTSKTSAIASASMSTSISNMASSLSTSSAIASSTSAAFNSTIAPNALPLTPKITPAFGIAGVILILSGVAYTFIGIRKRHLHVSLSTAYSTALWITILILYLTHLPVSNAIQGAYLVAAVVGGLIFGAGSLFIPDYAQSLGCVLGGYCISMWILTLKAGGLITSSGGRAGLIVGCAVVGLAMSVTRSTRSYAMPSLVSFSGATAIVLGIDCFSRAGLKEFWAYIWDVNKSLFPSGTSTYPLTTGIKVETGIIIVLFVAGMVMQVNVWKSFKEKYERKKEQKRTAERALEIEEENVGQLVEHQNQIDKDEWEAVYSNKEAGVYPKPADSGVGEMESLKKATSTNASKPNSRDGSVGNAGSNNTPARMSALFLSDEEKMGISIEGMRQNLTVMMVHEIPEPEIPVPQSPASPTSPTSPVSDIPNIAVHDFGTLVVSPKPSIAPSEPSGSERAPSRMDSEAGSRVGSQYGSQGISRVGSQMSGQGQSRSQSRNQSRQSVSRQDSSRSSVFITEAPAIVPLPFTIPTTPTEEDFPDDSSSIATFNDNPEDLKRKSRLLGSFDLINHFQDPPPQSQLVPGPRPRPTQRNSSGLMVPQYDEDKRLSTIANIDDDSDVDINEIGVPEEFTEGNVQTSSPQRSPTRQSFARGSSEYGQIENDEGPIPIGQAVTTHEEVDETLEEGVTPASEVLTVGTGILDQPASPAPVKEKEVIEESQEVAESEAPQFLPLVDSPPTTGADEPSKALSSVDDKNVEPVGRPSLSKDTLPAAVSKVVMSYRTNEWAKHLDTADIPIVEDPNLSPSPTTSEPDIHRELPAPVNVEALQQTPETAAIPPAQIIPTLRASQMPRSYSQPHLPRSNSNNSQLSAGSYRSSRIASKPAFELRGTMNRSSSQSSLPNTLNRSSSQTSLHSNYTTTPNRPREAYSKNRSTSTPVIGPVIEDPHEDVPAIPGRFSNMSSSALPNTSRNTLMSQRDNMIRQKSSFRGQINAHSLPVPHEDDDDNMSMSARREKLRQSTLNKLTSAVPTANRNPPNPARASAAPPPEQKDQMLRMWRASVQQDLQAGHGSRATGERQRSELWEKKQREAAQRQLEGEKARRSEYIKDERLRRGNLEEAHRMAMRRMQAGAKK